MIHSTASPRWWTPWAPQRMPAPQADPCGLRTSLRQGFGTAGGPWANDDTHICHHADGGGSPRELTGDTGGRRIPSQCAPLQWLATATLSHGEVITYLVNSSQGLAASYKYDAYGNLVSQSGSLAGANVYRFSSKEWLSTPGLYYYGYRWYAPNLQRWLNRDPIGERYDANLYRFVYNSPLNYVDPDGLTAWALYPPQGWFDPSIPAMIQSPEYQQGFQEGAAHAALKCWNAPNTLIGLAWGGVGYLFGAEITAGHNAIQFENHPFMPWGAITLGNTISYPPGFGPNYTLPNGTVGAHEMQHTFQGQVLGPFYLQANLAGGLYSLITAGNWHDNNFMEAGPMSNPPRPF